MRSALNKRDLTGNLFTREFLGELNTSCSQSNASCQICPNVALIRPIANEVLSEPCPRDLPPKSTVFDYSAKWRSNGTID